MRRLILFAKTPRLHEVKTRLVPPLTPAQALAFHLAFLEDQAAFVAAFAAASSRPLGGEICVDRPPDEGGSPSCAAGLPVTLQGSGDLGDRMARAFARAFAEGARAVAILGADAPSLPGGRVADLFDRLDGSDPTVLVVPAADGGFVMIGSRRPVDALFRGIPWGSPGVLAALRRRAAEAAVPLAEADGWYDVDRAEDLLRLRDDLERTPSRAPRTLRLYSRFPPVV